VTAIDLIHMDNEMAQYATGVAVIGKVIGLREKFL
jgi:hypothetical protein